MLPSHRSQTTSFRPAHKTHASFSARARPTRPRSSRSARREPSPADTSSASPDPTNASSTNKHGTTSSEFVPEPEDEPEDVGGFPGGDGFFPRSLVVVVVVVVVRVGARLFLSPVRRRSRRRADSARELILVRGGHGDVPLQKLDAEVRQRLAHALAPARGSAHGAHRGDVQHHHARPPLGGAAAVRVRPGPKRVGPAAPAGHRRAAPRRARRRSEALGVGGAAHAGRRRGRVLGARAHLRHRRVHGGAERLHRGRDARPGVRVEAVALVAVRGGRLGIVRRRRLGIGVVARRLGVVLAATSPFSVSSGTAGRGSRAPAEPRSVSRFSRFSRSPSASSSSVSDTVASAEPSVDAEIPADVAVRGGSVPGASSSPSPSPSLAAESYSEPDASESDTGPMSTTLSESSKSYASARVCSGVPGTGVGASSEAFAAGGGAIAAGAIAAGAVAGAIAGASSVTSSVASSVTSSFTSSVTSSIVSPVASSVEPDRCASSPRPPPRTTRQSRTRRSRRPPPRRPPPNPKTSPHPTGRPKAPG